MRRQGAFFGPQASELDLLAYEGNRDPLVTPATVEVERNWMGQWKWRRPQCPLIRQPFYLLLFTNITPNKTKLDINSNL